MTSSRKRLSLSRPIAGEPIDLNALRYVEARNKNRINSDLLDLFDESGISKADLARMLHRKPEQVTRWLGSPGNLTVDTISDLTFALTGNFIKIDMLDELSKSRSNHQNPAWLSYDEGWLFSEETETPRVETRTVISDTESDNPFLIQVSSESEQEYGRER